MSFYNGLCHNGPWADCWVDNEHDTIMVETICSAEENPDHLFLKTGMYKYAEDGDPDDGGEGRVWHWFDLQHNIHGHVQ